MILHTLLMFIGAIEIILGSKFNRVLEIIIFTLFMSDDYSSHQVLSGDVIVGVYIDS